MNLVKTTKNTSSKLGTERVPHTVLDLLLLALGVGAGDRDALLAVHALARGQVAGDKEVLLALGNVDTVVLVRLDGDGAGALLAQSTATTAGTATATASSTSTVSATG